MHVSRQNKKERKREKVFDFEASTRQQASKQSKATASIAFIPSIAD
jgi:hypothetical protein